VDARFRSRRQAGRVRRALALRPLLWELDRELTGGLEDPMTQAYGCAAAEAVSDSCSAKERALLKRFGFSSRDEVEALVDMESPEDRAQRQADDAFRALPPEEQERQMAAIMAAGPGAL